MGDVFISYKQDERERMRPIAEGLSALGVDVWFDERLQPDRTFTDEIQDVMNNCRAQIVCWSPAAAASEWVRGEAEVARQRGVLVAVMIEPCALPPPFNMHHAENLSGWTGDARHPGWRKIAEAVGRKLGRPGLGELAALAQSNDAATWKKWAQKYPDDPKADEAWAKIESLEVSAARERLARDRDAARKPPPQPAPAIQPPPSASAPIEAPRPGASPLVAIVAVVAAVALLGGLYVSWRAFQPTQTDAIAATEPSLESAASSPDASAVPTEVAAEAPAPAPAEVQPDPAQSAIAALNAVPARYWSAYDAPVILHRVLRNTTMESLRAAAASDARAKVALGHALQFGLRAERDEAAAARLYRQASAAGNARAAYDLGYMYSGGAAAVTQDMAEAFRLYRLAADRGNARAQNEIGVSLAHGLNIERDREAGARYLRAGAAQNYSTALSNLASLEPYEESQRLIAASSEAERAERDLSRAALTFFGLD